MGNFFQNINRVWNPAPASAPPAKPQAAGVQTLSVSQVGASLREVPKASSDTFASAQAMPAHVASAVRNQPSLTLEDSQGRKVQANQYLNAQEEALLSRLCELDPALKSQLLNLNSRGASVATVRQRLVSNLEQSIRQMTEGGKITFTSEAKRSWQVEDLLGLALAVKQLPIAQRKQLDGVTFHRAERPALPQGVPVGMLERIASDTIAGHYDVENKMVKLYDRGAQDGLPPLSNQLQQSLQNIRNRSNKEDVRQLQRLLNPYLAGMKEAAIPEDGSWGPKTTKAIRMVQTELIAHYAESSGRPLSANQKAELNRLRVIAASPQFDMIARMTDLSGRLQQLNLLPDAHMQQLLQEFARSEFGEASLKVLMQDISNDFRSMQGQISRVEEIMTHEMGHHFQLGIRNESHYITEFAKISDWRETASGDIADGFIDGMYSNEGLADVYGILASDKTVDQGHYHVGNSSRSPESRSQMFVSTYAATDPMEDFAESYKTFVLDPVSLYKASPEKFFFINSLPAIQARLNSQQSDRVDGQLQKSHYFSARAGDAVDREGKNRMRLEEIVRKALEDKYQITPTDEHIKQEIRTQFEKVMGLSAHRTQSLKPDIVMSMLDTHQDILNWAGMPPVSVRQLTRFRDADEAVFNTINRQMLDGLRSGSTRNTRAFLEKLKSPAQIDTLFPKASPELRAKLKDPTFMAMTLTLSQISAQGLYLNELRNVEYRDQQAYRNSESYFTQSGGNLGSLLRSESLSQGFNLVRGWASGQILNPEAGKIEAGERFLLKIEQNPRQMFPELWNQLPEAFQELLQDRYFLQQASGDRGRVKPSAEVTRQTLQQIMEVVEYQRSLEGL
ncbi:MAG: hypothetical protein ACO1RX_04650 [Candidatus Sericytochromatia bacterium]